MKTLIKIIHCMMIISNIPPDASFNFEQVKNSAVLHLINQLKHSHCYGCDIVCSDILKTISTEVSPCITLIINQTLSTDIFLSKLITTKVILFTKTMTTHY